MPQQRTWTAASLSGTGVRLERWEFMIDNSDEVLGNALGTRVLTRAHVAVERDDGKIKTIPTDWINLDDVPGGIVSDANKTIIKQAWAAVANAAAALVEAQA